MSSSGSERSTNSKPKWQQIHADSYRHPCRRSVGIRIYHWRRHSTQPIRRILLPSAKRRSLQAFAQRSPATSCRSNTGAAAVTRRRPKPIPFQPFKKLASFCQSPPASSPSRAKCGLRLSLASVDIRRDRTARPREHGHANQPQFLISPSQPLPVLSASQVLIRD